MRVRVGCAGPHRGSDGAVREGGAWAFPCAYSQFSRGYLDTEGSLVTLSQGGVSADWSGPRHPCGQCRSYLRCPLPRAPLVSPGPTVWAVGFKKIQGAILRQLETPSSRGVTRVRIRQIYVPGMLL